MTTERSERVLPEGDGAGGAARWLRANAGGVGAAALALLLGAGTVRWLSAGRAAHGARKEQPFTMVRVVPEKPAPPPPPKAPPPRPVPEPAKVVEPPRTSRVELKPEDLAPAPSPAPAAANPGGGRLALAASAEGPGDAFNLSGNPGGRGLLSGGGLGDGSGEGSGDGVGNDSFAARYGWYIGKVRTQTEELFRRNKKLRSVSARVELRVTIDPGGRITELEPVGANVDPAVREAVGEAIGLVLDEPPPQGLPTFILRLNAHRPK